MSISLARLLAPLAAALGLAVFASAASAEPALWVAEGPHAKVYLFGTVHLMQADTRWMSPRIQQAFDESQDLTLEIAELDDDAAAIPIVQKLGVDADHSLTAELAPPDQAAFAKTLASLGYPPAAFDHMRPWLAAVTLSTLPLQKQGFDPKEGVDRVLERAAKAKGKPILGFETLEQQLDYFADLPQRQQISFLRESLKDFPTIVPDLSKLEKDWEDGRVDDIARDMDADMQKEDPALYDLLIVRRNKAFAAAIAKRLDSSGTSFVAVGAGHLAGPDSVQAELEKRGFKVRRL